MGLWNVLDFTKKIEGMIWVIQSNKIIINKWDILLYMFYNDSCLGFIIISFNNVVFEVWIYIFVLEI